VIETTPRAPWTVAFLQALPHGVAVGVHLPEGADPVQPEVLSRLTGPERKCAEGLRAYRQVQFVGGRLALAAGFAEMGARRVPVLTDEHGAPTLPEGLVGSVTHKQDLAVALLARGRAGVGVDLEDTDRPRPGVAARVLTPRELAAVEALVPHRQWVDTVVRFSVKESVYKAVHPTLRRYVGFGEIEVWPDTGGVDRLEPLVPDLARFQFTARHNWIGTRVLSTVRAELA
jgi:4'-phosphopantetheinyl transferase EntD